MTALLIKLAIRLVVFTGVFWWVAKRNPKIAVRPTWALPLVAGVFALLNIGLYWLLKPIFNLATFGTMAFLAPLLINAALLVATLRIVTWRRRRRAAATPAAPAKGAATAAPAEKPPWLVIDGFMAMAYLVVALTAAHLVLYVAVDYLPTKL